MHAAANASLVLLSVGCLLGDFSDAASHVDGAIALVDTGVIASSDVRFSILQILESPLTVIITLHCTQARVFCSAGRSGNRRPRRSLFTEPALVQVVSTNRR